jgi:hypothetical protein
VCIKQGFGQLPLISQLEKRIKVHDFTAHDHINTILINSSVFSTLKRTLVCTLRTGHTIMPAYSILILGLVALFGPPASAWTECVPVSYDTFQHTKNLDRNPILGPKGIYAKNVDGICIYVDASANSDFANNHGPEYSAFIASVNSSQRTIPGLEFLSAAPEARTTPNIVSNALRRRAVACKTVCGNSITKKKCQAPCTCQFAFNTCQPNGSCLETYTCQK